MAVNGECFDTSWLYYCNDHRPVSVVQIQMLQGKGNKCFTSLPFHLQRISVILLHYTHQEYIHYDEL